MSDVIAFFTNVRTCFDIGVVAAKSGVVFVGVVFVAASSRGDGVDASALDANVRCVVARSMRDACSTGDTPAPRACSTGEMGALARGDAVVDGKSARFARVGARRDDPSSSDFDIFLGVAERRGERTSARRSAEDMRGDTVDACVVRAGSIAFGTRTGRVGLRTWRNRRFILPLLGTREACDSFECEYNALMS